MLLGKNQRYTLYECDSDVSNLRDVRSKILVRTNEDLLDLKNIPEETPYEEKCYNSVWDSISESSEVTLPNVDDTSENEEINRLNTVTYLTAMAVCEYSTRRKRDKEKNLLPKKDRLNTAYIDVVFIENNSKVYIVICNDNPYNLKRVKNLISNEYINLNSDFIKIESEIFHWLFYQYMEKKRDLSSNIELENIIGFTGEVLNAENTFEGNSDQTAELVITKAFIANGYPITSMKIDMCTMEGNLKLYINQNSKLIMMSGTDIALLMENQKIEFILPIYVYFYLIPKLYFLLEEMPKTFNEILKPDFSKKIGLEVIISICTQNNISINDLEKFFVNEDTICLNS